MASPQLINGYTSIANEIIEHLGNTSILGSEFQVVLCVLRKTYGYHKKEDRISLTQFEKWTGLSRATVVKALKNLVIRNILVKTAIPTYKFNKDYETWVVNTAKLVKHNDLGSIDRLTKIGIDGYTYKRKKEITKETMAKETEYNPKGAELIKSFELINPAVKRMYGNTTQRLACNDLIGTYGFERVKTVIEKTLPKTNKMEYMPSITTPYMLFLKWSQLESQINKLKNKKKQNVIW